MKVNGLIGTIVAIGIMGCGCSQTAVPEIPNASGNLSEAPENDEDTVTVFMNALVSHNIETVARIGGAQTYGAYKFLEKVRFSDWQLEEISGSAARVKLNISESGEADFPEGESVWTIELSDGENEYFSSFRRDGDNEKTVLADNVSALDVSDAVKMCYAFTSEFGWVSTDESIIDMKGSEKIVEKERFIEDLVMFCAYFSEDEQLSGSVIDFPADKLSESAKLLIGVENLDFTVLPSYNKVKNTVENRRSKYCWGYASLADEQYENGVHSVTIDWYSDTIMLAKARTIRYTLTDNPNGSMRLCTTETLFDSGEPVAFLTRSGY